MGRHQPAGAGVGEAAQAGVRQPRPGCISATRPRRRHRMPRAPTTPPARCTTLPKRRAIRPTAGRTVSTPRAFSGERVAASFANGGVKFNGTQSLALPAINAAGGMSVAMWVKPAALDGVLLQADGLNVALAAGVLNGAGRRGQRRHDRTADGGQMASPGDHAWPTRSRSMSTASWQARRRARRCRPAALTLGAGYSGELDEVQLAGTARDAAWFAVQAAQGPERHAGDAGRGRIQRRWRRGRHLGHAVRRADAGRLDRDRHPGGDAGDRGLDHDRQGDLCEPRGPGQPPVHAQVPRAVDRPRRDRQGEGAGGRVQAFLAVSPLPRRHGRAVASFQGHRCRTA